MQISYELMPATRTPSIPILRENGKEKLLVMLNFSGKEEPVILTETSIIGSVTNVIQ
jgi:hypothetical protein